MTSENLEAKIQRIGDPLRMLRDTPAGRFKFPYPAEHTNWQEEQRAWTTTATLFDQSHHMTDVYFRGPDVKRLLSDTGTNSFANFGRNRSKHFVACNPDGHIIGTAVLFGLEDDEVNLVGPAAAANWVQYHAETGGYDVEVMRDERTADNTGKRLTFRYEIEGPATLQILEQASAGTLGATGFFQMTEFALRGVPVRALSHTMVGVPGSDSMGFEIWGPVEEEERVLEALLIAGQQHGMLRGGALAYYTGSIESGYMAQPTAAVYTHPDLVAYRERLPGDGYEGTLSVGGSYSPKHIEELYVTPYEFGYGHLVRFDHDFIGRDALEKAAQDRRVRKVWLRWNNEDVTRIYASSLFDGDDRAKYLDTPLARYARVQADAVLDAGTTVGISNMCGYTVNAGAWISMAMIDEELATDGRQLILVWGEEQGGTAKLAVEPHKQIEIRVEVRTTPPVG